LGAELLDRLLRAAVREERRQPDAIEVNRLAGGSRRRRRGGRGRVRLLIGIVVAAARARGRRGEQQAGSTGYQASAKRHRLPKDYEPFVPPAKNLLRFLHASPPFCAGRP